jgi:plasmid stabilization system protein ParE
MSFNAQFSQKFQNRVKTELQSCIVSLADFPFLAPIYNDNPNYRKLVVLHYLVFYKVSETERAVEIHRVLHSSRDVFTVLNA